MRPATNGCKRVSILVGWIGAYLDDMRTALSEREPRKANGESAPRRARRTAYLDA